MGLSKPHIHPDVLPEACARLDGVGLSKPHIHPDVLPEACARLDGVGLSKPHIHPDMLARCRDLELEWASQNPTSTPRRIHEPD